MKAMVCENYGAPDVLQLKEVEKPSPKDKEILIKVGATAVNSADWRLRKPDPFAVRLFFGFIRPKKRILGGVLAGEVVQTGKNVRLFKVGDKVFGSTGMSFGAYAEYKCLAEDAVITHAPNNMTYQEAAVVPFGGLTALYFLRKAGIKKGLKVLIYGASGAVGTAAVQLAKHFEAEVTGVCSTSNVPMVRSLGADKVIDYTKEDFSQSGQTFDIIFDTVGKIPSNSIKSSLRDEGCLILGAAGMAEMILGAWTSLTSRMKVISGVTSELLEDLVFLKELIEAGKFKAIIDRHYSLEQLAEAHAYVELGHKKGNVAVSLEQRT